MSRYTIKDIAKICGVGTSTVSRVINNDYGVNEKTREKVMAAVKKYHYVPNNSAVNLKKSDSNNVAVLVKGRNNPFLQSIYSVFDRELQKFGYVFTVREVDSNEDEVRIAQELIREKRLKGMIFLGGLMENPDRELRHIDIPYVLCTVAMRTDESDCGIVTIDDVAEAEKAVDYLCEKGHKKIAIIAGRKDDFGVGELRKKGYMNALKKHGIDYNEELVGYMEQDIPDYSYENGYAVARKLLESGKDFTALFAVSDTTAFGAYRAISEAGKKIPDDISVVGFDGINMTKFMTPSLTTISQPGEKMAEEAVKILHSEINGIDIKKHKIYSGTLTEMESVKELKDV